MRFRSWRNVLPRYLSKRLVSTELIGKRALVTGANRVRTRIDKPWRCRLLLL